MVPLKSSDNIGTPSESHLSMTILHDDTVRHVLFEHHLQSKQPNNAVFARQPRDYLYYENLSNVAMASASFISGCFLL